MAQVAAPPAIARVCERTAQQERGVVLYRVHRVFDVHAGPMHRHDDLVLGIVSEDGAVVKVRVLSGSIGGKAASAAAKEQIANAYEHPAPADVFHRPFDPRFAAEYTIAQTGVNIFHFSSTIRDSAHGDGNFWIDPSLDVVRYQFTPYVLPRYSTAGSVTIDRAQVLPQYWAATREAHTYTGHYAIFSGGATVQITYDSFARYRDSASAVAALTAW